MFRITPNQKQIDKYFGSVNTLKNVPTDWEEFTKLTTIRSGGEMRKFECYEYQKILVKLAKQFPIVVILKSRQMGITQAITSKFLHDAIINPAASSVAFMRNGEDASSLSRRVRQMLNSIPEYAVSDNDNVGYLKVKNGGDIYFKNSSKEGSRSLDSCTAFLFDEAAFVENIQQIYSASSPSSALVGDKIQKFIVSTPSAKSGWYWDKLNENNGNIDIEELASDVASGRMYTDIPGVYWFKDKANTCKLILHWKAHPVYSQIPNYLQYRLEQDGTNEEIVSREYDLRFVDSAVAVFNSELIRKNAIGQPEIIRNKDAEYYLGIDTSTFGNDYTVCVVLKFFKGIYSIEEIYRKRQETSDYHIYQIGKLIDIYKPEKIGVEITGGVGSIYLEQLSKIYKSTKIEAIRTTGDSKPAMISNLVLALEKGALIYPSKCPIIEEMLSFRREGNKLEAAPGKHDDVIMSTAFALLVTDFSKKLNKPFNIK
ncbi:Terminase-like family protein [Calothrix sp. FACHB-156]|nr:Terminase-like family protein [Calothrix sp. FACHB-156]